MARQRNKFSSLNDEKNTKLQVLSSLLTFFLGFVVVSALLGVGVFLFTHG